MIDLWFLMFVLLAVDVDFCVATLGTSTNNVC